MKHPPNIMLLQCEDTGLHLGCYGEAYASTPHMDGLAAEGARFTNAFSHSPVCAPSRGGMVTGRHPWSLGNHLMRCTLVDPPRMFTHELVDAGYHVAWPTKLDFNFEPTPGWCSGTDPWWKGPAPEAPFFLYRNFPKTHESTMFAPSPPFDAEEFPCPDAARHDPAAAPVPAFLPDTPELRRQVATYHDALSAIDQQVGECLRWLDATGHRDDTVVILLSDHGRGLPREKRWCYDAGLHLPLLVRWPGMIEPGSVIDDLVAWVDLAPTVLALAGVPIPGDYQGRVFVGPDRAPPPECVFGGRDRMDEVFDKQRVARDKRFLYVRNDAPWLPWAQRQSYMEQQPILPVMRRLHAEGKLHGDEAVFFRPTKPPEELFDVEADPFQLRNLVDDPAHAPVLARLRSALEAHLAEVGDLGEVDERELIARGIVTDRLPEYELRKAKDELPPELILGPRPIPTTLEEARRFRGEGRGERGAGGGERMGR